MTSNIWYPILFQILETVRGGNLVDLITVNEMCYKSANVASVANVVQICTGRILFLLESTKLSQPDKIVNATVHVIVIKILIVVVIVIRSPKFQQNKFILRVKICFQKLLWTFNFGKFGVIVRLSLEIGINVKCQEEVARHSL